MSADTKDKLERVLDLMSHANPRRSLATAFDRALDVLLRDLEKKRLGKTSRPRKSRGVKHGNIGRSTLREVYERDGVQCVFVSEAGVRCTSRVFLQTDHVIARALGGSGATHNARVLCQPHNLFEAEETFGAEHVARKIEERRRRARSCRVGARTRGGEIEESGNHRRQERLGPPAVGASCASDGAGSSLPEGSLTQAASDNSGNHRRQERLRSASADPQRVCCRDDSPQFERTTTKVAFDESGNHRRQERLGTEGSVGGLLLRHERSDTGRQCVRCGEASPQFERTTTKAASDESGNRLRQEKLGTPSGDPPRAGRGDDSSCRDADGFSRGAKCENRAVENAPHAANAAEVRGKLFAALTTMGFRRGETRNAIGKLERRSELGRAPIHALLREALALLTR